MKGDAVRHLRAGLLIDGTGAKPVADATVVVEDGRIAWVGETAAAPPVGDGGTVVDLGPCTLLPGLIDTHSHPISFPRPGDPVDLLHWADELRLLHSVQHLAAALRSGITTIRDCGAPRVTAFALKEAVEEGVLESPRLLVAGRPICPTGGHGHKAGSEADGPWGVRRETRKLFKEGADFLKLTATGGGTARTARHRATFTVEELRAAREEAELHDSYATAHCHGTEGIIRCLEAGVPMIEHATFVALDGKESFDAEVADRMAEQGTVVVPTVQIHGRWLEEGAERVESMPEEERALFHRRTGSFERRLELVKLLYDSGVEILMGSDAGTGRNYQAPLDDLGYGLRLHVEVGLPVVDVVASATGRAADHLGIGGLTGTLTEGKEADIIALAGNPMEDVVALERTVFVMKSGRVIREPEASLDS